MFIVFILFLLFYFLFYLVLFFDIIVSILLFYFLIIFLDGGISRIRLHGKPSTISTLAKCVSESFERTIKAVSISDEVFINYGEVLNRNNTKSGESLPWRSKPASEKSPLQFSLVNFAKKSLPLSVSSLKKNTSSSETYIPSKEQSKYLVVVCLAGKNELPDLFHIKAFVANGNQVVSIKSGVWYLDIVPIENDAEFFVLSGENEQKTHTFRNHKFTVTL